MLDRIFSLVLREPELCEEYRAKKSVERCAKRGRQKAAPDAGFANLRHLSRSIAGGTLTIAPRVAWWCDNRR
jgi:hypothetical protein